MANDFLKDYYQVNVGSLELSANKDITQHVEVVDDCDKYRRMTAFLKEHGVEKMIVFVETKRGCDQLTRSLQMDGFPAKCIHGDKGQDERDWVLNEFRAGKCPLLVATDVAARGLDIPNVEIVINFSFPLTIEDYVHRIGRTGRAGKHGIAETFFHGGGHEKALAGALQNVLRGAGCDVPAELLAYGSTVKKKEHKLYGAFGPKAGEVVKKAVKITF
mmetsp:Transcript_29726/g.102380  ORF Transcript_29726/g.102380 Transcript_29726/m.102380 type:complete len:217 (+) Transcript_29726:1148-1798(+)